MSEHHDKLAEAVRRLHGGDPEWVETVDAVELHDGAEVWRRAVEVFSLRTHPLARQAFAWSEPIPGTTRARYFAVLRVGPIESAHDAVRASLLQDGRG